MVSRRVKIWLAPAIILALWFLWSVAIILHGNGRNLLKPVGISEFDYTTAGEFGDAFGSLSAFMAALAAAGAWRAVSLSRSQSFETTFYNLLNHLNNLVSGTDIKTFKDKKGPEGKPERVQRNLHERRDAFKWMLTSLRKTIAATKRETESERVIDGYRKFHDRYKNELAHYFRTIYHIVLYIENSPFVDRHLYARILRAQMSDSEQTLLMYNCAVGKGREKFKALVERYSLLHNLSVNEIASHWENTILRRSFGASAFRDDATEPWPTAEDLDADVARVDGVATP